MAAPLVLYKSKYGTTRTYAEALGRALSCPALSVDNARPQDISLADTVIIGGSIRASGLGFARFVKANAQALQGKRLVFFAVGASPVPGAGDDTLEQIRKRGLGKLFPEAPLFYCRGDWDMEGMTFLDRTLCSLLIKSLQKKDVKELAPWQKALRDAGTKKTSWYDEKYLAPILAAARAG